MFGLVQHLVDEGYDLVEFYHGLLDVLRTMLRLRLSPDADVDVQEDIRLQLAERAAAFAPGDLVRMLSAAADLESQGSLRRSPNPRLPIEMLLLRMSFLDRTVGLEELIGALGGAPPAAGGAGSQGGGGADGGSDVGRRGPGAKEGVAAGEGAEASTPHRVSKSSVGHTGARPGLTVSSPAEPDSGIVERARVRVEADATQDPVVAASTAELSGANSTTELGGTDSTTDLGVADSTTDPGVADSTEDPAVPEPIVPTDDIVEAWNRWVGSGRGMPAGLGPFLHSASIVEDDDGGLVITPLPGPAVERLGQSTVIEAIREGMTPFLGRRPVLRVVTPAEAQAPAERITREEVHADTLKALYRQEPRLERAVEELDLELME